MSEVRRHRLQSHLLLPAARIVMLWVAAAAFLVTIVALAVGAFYYAQSTYVPKIPSPPPVELDTGDTWDPSEFPPDVVFQTVNVDRNRLRAGDVVAVIFSAHDLDSVARVTISPGPSADFFAVQPPPPRRQNEALRISRPILRQFKLLATPALIADLADSSDGKTYRLNFKLEFEENRDTPVGGYNFSIAFPGQSTELRGPEGPAAVRDLPAPASKAAAAAQALALIIDPQRTPAYFAAYERALKEIQSCGSDHEAYADALLKQVNAHREKLKRYNVLRFNSRVCDLWRAAVAKHAQQESERAAELALAAAEALAKRGLSMIAMYVAGSALATFLMLALALALFAIENHVRAIREKEGAPLPN